MMMMMMMTMMMMMIRAVLAVVGGDTVVTIATATRLLGNKGQRLCPCRAWTFMLRDSGPESCKQTLQPWPLLQIRDLQGAFAM